MTLAAGAALASLALHVGASPAVEPASASLLYQRETFLGAESALRAGDRIRYRTLRARLDHYALAPYLDYAELEARLAGARPDEVERFIEANGDGPLVERLRRRWLETLARGQRWKAFLEFYRPGSGTELACWHLQALLATGDREEAMRGVPSLWLVGRSQPDACDPAFEVWIAAGGATPERAWARTGLAMRAGELGLARYLERFLDEPSRTLASAWRTLRSSPERVAEVLTIEADQSRVEEVVGYALERLARRAPERAAARLAAVDASFALGAATRASVERAIGLAFARRHDERAIEWLARVPDTDADRQVREWRISASVLHGRWDLALELIAALDDAEREADRWRYWSGRSLAALGREAEAGEHFADAATGRGFYAFLSADRIEAPYAFDDAPLEVSDAAIAALAAEPAVRRARELLAIERRIDARREWHHVTRDMDDDARAVAAKLAERWGWHGRAALTIARTEHLDDLTLRFPVAYGETVKGQAAARGVESPWIFAVVRQESAFVPDARSPAGALGLMQIMPSTGRQLARRLGERPRGRSVLLDPDTSVRYGSAYLAMLRERFGGNELLASAAYNAGPRRVQGWLPERAPVEADRWVENVPFTETRRYVRRVMAYTAIYQHRLGLPVGRLSDRMVPIPTREALARRSDRSAG